MKLIRTALITLCALITSATLVFAAGLVDLNTASLKDLEALKGVGKATANKIIAARPYASVAELSKAGLSAKQIAAIKPFVTVGSGTPAATPSATKVVASVPTAARTGGAIATGPLDLNTATEKQLEALKGVGPATARKIIAGRPYRSTDDLSKAGLSSKQVAELKPLVMVAGTPVPTPSAPLSTPKTRTAAVTLPGTGPIDLNTATEKDLESLKGIGPATAKKIIAARPFKSVDDLSRAGVSARVIAEIRPLVTISGGPAPAPVHVTPSVATTVPVVPTSAPPPPVVTTAQPAGPVHAAASKLAPGQVVNINTASKELLDELPGIGPVKAQAIIDGRPYATIEDIMKVKGIKQGEFSKIKNLITVK